MRSRQERQASRRLGVAKVLRETPNATNVELAKVFDVDRDTIAEDRKFLMSQVNEGALTETQIYRDDQLARVTEKWDEIEHDESMSGAEKHLAWSRWMKLEMDLRGTAAPTKSITATINADVDPEKLVGYRKFLYHTRHLSEADVNRLVFPFCDTLPPTETPAHLLEPSEDMKRGYVLEGKCEPTNS
jgi:hypothetical protein